MMIADRHLKLKYRIAPYRAALYDYDGKVALRLFESLTAPKVNLHMCTPFGSFVDPSAFFAATYGALNHALPDLECRDHIRIAGCSQDDLDWVGIMGTVMGAFKRPFLGIPATGHLVHMRYHEFYRFDGDLIVEMHAIWDIPELMMQAGVWPMVPSLGREINIPGPAAGDGIANISSNPEQSRASLELVTNMLEQMKAYPAMGGPEAMKLERFWHAKMSWYGPAGIGSTRGYDGFTRWHMNPWICGMPDWSDQDFQDRCQFFGDGVYVGETGWPAMQQTIIADGFLGIAPSREKLDIRGLDFWRREEELIRENWVMVDLLHMYEQLGVDVFARMLAMSKTF